MACGSLLLSGRQTACNYLLFFEKEVKEGTVSASGIAIIQKQAKKKEKHKLPSLTGALAMQNHCKL